jgi:two-component system, NtrC family, sensor kinase
MKCPRCQHKNPSQARLCTACGARLAVRAKRQRAGAKAPLPAGRKTPKNDHATVHDLENRLAEALKREAEALEQQAATSEILRVISSSPTDVQPVFKAIGESAVRLMGAAMASVYEFDGTLIYLHTLTPPDWPHAEELRRQYPRPPDVKLAAGRVILERSILHLADLQTDPMTPSVTRQVAERMGLKGVLWVPMLRDGVPIGVIGAVRATVGLFSDKQVRLLQTFADQAVIAIENVRLFNATKESLERQTATSEILRVIAGSPTDVQPVFATIMENALRLCSAQTAAVMTFDGHVIHAGAFLNIPADAEERMRRRFPRVPDHSSAAGRAILTGDVAEIPDVEAEPDYAFASDVRAGGLRSNTAVPMLRDGRVIGTINLGRAVVGRLSESEIALLKTFADQAVIAIENVRLFKELQARTQDLTRSVEQLTALGEVGRAVSSTLDLETVLITIVSRAVELSGLDGGVVFEYDEATEEFVHRVATEAGAGLAEARRSTRIRKGEGAVGQTALTLAPAQVADITVPGAYESRLRETLIASGIRAVLAVPMVREGELIGCLVVSRNRPGEFTADTIELLRTFATQSVLAIQNARLFREIEIKSRELEAASRHKSEFLANMSHELRTPLNAIIGFSEVLSERLFGELNDKQDEYLKDIHASGQHLLSLINDILDLSKIEAGKMELEVSGVDLPLTIENALTLVRERAARRGIALHRSVDERLGQIQADERKIRQVLLNLLSNAIKFTPEAGRIDVEAKPEDGFIQVSVSDTGVGIAPADQAAVFEEFKQVGTADKKVEGTGLGLALSRKFIELHGGRIWVKSQVGAGSTFSFTIPMHRGQ